MLLEKDFDITACFDIVSPQPGLLMLILSFSRPGGNRCWKVSPGGQHIRASHRIRGVGGTAKGRAKRAAKMGSGAGKSSVLEGCPDSCYTSRGSDGFAI